MTAFLTKEFARLLDDSGKRIGTLNAGTSVDSIGGERSDAVKIQVRSHPATIGWIAKEQLKPGHEPVAPELDVQRFIMTARNAVNTINRAFPDDAIELSSALLLTLAWIESGWKNAGGRLPVTTGVQPDTKFGPFGFRPVTWASTISDAKYASILRDVTAFSRIDPYLQCYVAACRINELQSNLLATIGEAPSSTLIRIADLIGPKEADRFVKLGSTDTVDKEIDGQPALDMATIAAHGGLFSTGGSPHTREKVEVVIDGQLKEAAAAAAAEVAEVDRVLGTELGILSREYEARGPGDVSGGIGDPGGVSYGSYQMTSKPGGGTVQKFVRGENFPWAENFNGLEPGRKEFTAAWKELAEKEPAAFFAAQHSYIKRNYFDAQANKIKSGNEFDVMGRSVALQNVVWSTAVQHGADTHIVGTAINRVKRDEPKALADVKGDRPLIRAVYAERGKRNPSGGLAHFSSSSADVQKGVAKRFIKEEQDALLMFDRVD